MKKLLALLLGISFFAAVLSCEPPVSNDATIQISGVILNEDGSPAEDATVKLWRNDLALFDNDGFTGIMIESGTPYKTATTNAEGEYSFSFNGAQANSSGGSFAAYFTVTTTRENTIESVATNPHQFSNQNLSWNIPDMQYWNDVTVTLEGETISLEWGSAPNAQTDTRYYVWGDSFWTDGVSENTYELSTLALPVNGDGSESFHIMSLEGSLRYRTNAQVVEASNPRGSGIDYRQPANNNIHATDCDGGNLFDLNDGEINEVERFQTSSEEGTHCVIITLAESTHLSDLLVHNAMVYDDENANVEYAYQNDEVSDFTVFATEPAFQTDFSSYYDHLKGLDIEATSIRISVEASSYFMQIGEITLYENIEAQK